MLTRQSECVAVMRMSEADLTSPEARLLWGLADELRKRENVPVTRLELASILEAVGSEFSRIGIERRGIGKRRVAAYDVCQVCGNSDPALLTILTRDGDPSVIECCKCNAKFETFPLG